MHFILRICFVFLLINNLTTIQAQSVIKELNAQDLNIYTVGEFLNFSNGDLLYSDYNNNFIQFSRMDPELKSIRWTKNLRFNQLECDFPTDSIYPEDNVGLRPVYIDRKDQIWCIGSSYNHPNPDIYHFVLLDENADFLWYKGISELEFITPFSFSISNESQNGLYFYWETYLGDLQRLNKLHIDYNGTMKVLSAFEYPYSLHNFPNSEFKSNPSGNLLLTNTTRNSFMDFHFFDLEKNEIVLLQRETIPQQNPYSGSRIEWINDEEFIISNLTRNINSHIPYLNVSLYIARVNINGDIKWSKRSDAENSFLFRTYDFIHLDQNLIEGTKLFMPLHRSDGAGTGYLTINLENGNLLESNFWASRNLFQIDRFESKRIGNLVYYVDQDFYPFDSINLNPKWLIYDNLNDPKSCLTIPVCDFEWTDFDFNFQILKAPFTQIEIDTIVKSSCRLKVESTPVLLDWREVCPEIIQVPDAFFFMSADSLCSGELFYAIVQHDQNTFKYSWTINGIPVNPVSVSNDTFYFIFNLTGNLLLSLTTSRLGCEANFERSIHLVPGAEIDGPDDRFRCIGQQIEINLEGKEGFILQWDNGSNPLNVDTAGIYTYTSTNIATGCSISKSVEVRDLIPPGTDIVSSYSFCQEDLKRNILPKVTGITEKLQWIYPNQQGNLLLFPERSDTYLLRVENKACIDTISVVVDILPCIGPCQIFIPDAFSPNDDGINDFFEIFIGCRKSVLTFRMEIFDRWGNMVFQSDAFNRQWDGNIEDKLAPAGGYAYKLKMTLESENEFEEVFREGFVGLVR